MQQQNQLGLFPPPHHCGPHSPCATQNGVIQWAGWTATPENTYTPSSYDCPIFIKQKLAEKRRLWKEWHRTRIPTSKKLLNRASHNLRQLLHQHKNANIQTFLHGLTPTASTDYSLWKTTKKLKTVTQPSLPIRTSQGTWARSNTEKAQAFANHLASVFQPHPSDSSSTPEATLKSLLETTFQLEPPVNRLKPSEVKAIITNLSPTKSLGYDLITSRTLKELPTLGFQYLTQLFSAILLHGYFPAQWKVAQMILIPKLGKPPHSLSSYRPISLLPIASKVFEKLLLKRLLPLVEHGKLLPTHQFAFRPRHSTIEQPHRLIQGINDALDNRQYCSAAFLDISQAFDKV
jgi:hypothetical protein